MYQEANNSIYRIAPTNQYSDFSPEQSGPVPIVMKNTVGRRLFFGSVASEVTDDILRKMADEIAGCVCVTDCYVNGEKSFAFLDFDTRENATRVKDALDGRNVYGRTMMVRRASHKSSIFVKDVPDSVSNEILYKAFEQFGPVERAIIIADAHGKSLKQGFVEFLQKRSSAGAVKQCSEQMFCLTRTSPPVRVEMFVPNDDEDGVAEHKINRSAQQAEEVSVAPRFLRPGTMVHGEFTKWREMVERHDKEIADIKEQHSNDRLDMLRSIKKTVQESDSKRAQEDREKQLKDWQEFQDKKFEAMKLQRELEQLQGRFNPGGPHFQGGAYNVPAAGGYMSRAGPQRPGPSMTAPGPVAGSPYRPDVNSLAAAQMMRAGGAIPNVGIKRRRF